MKHAIMIDFGSTFTKVVLADLEERRVLLTDKFPSTVHTDAGIALSRCFDAVRKVISPKEFEDALKLSSSSAAGGLRMAVIGLTRSLSVTAGRETVFGAGAKVMGTFYGWLTEDHIRQIEALDLEIILLCGGYENGNQTMVLHNASMIANSQIHTPVVYSGNKAVAKDVRTLFRARRKECFVIDNILPAVGEINIEPSQEIIRHLFMQRITNMKGLAGVKKDLGEILMPTPAAVLAAGELLSQGTETQEGLGDLMMVDVGGATTDIYSFNVNHAANDAILVGVPEPYAKRTVEGDMGMRESSVCVLREVGAERLAKEAGVTEEDIEEAVGRRISDISILADDFRELAVDEAIARMAVHVSARRHAGKLEYSYSGNCDQIQRGKNLNEIRMVIGTGGQVVNSPDPATILKQVELADRDRDILLPKSVEPYIDRDYVLYAAGLLRHYDEEAAFAIIKDSLKKV